MLLLNWWNLTFTQVIKATNDLIPEHCQFSSSSKIFTCRWDLFFFFLTVLLSNFIWFNILMQTEDWRFVILRSLVCHLMMPSPWNHNMAQVFPFLHISIHFPDLPLSCLKIINFRPLHLSPSKLHLIPHRISNQIEPPLVQQYLGLFYHELHTASSVQMSRNSLLLKAYHGPNNFQFHQSFSSSLPSSPVFIPNHFPLQPLIGCSSMIGNFLVIKTVNSLWDWWR